MSGPHLKNLVQVTPTLINALLNLKKTLLTKWLAQW